MIAELAIVGDVGVAEEIIVGADAGGHLGGGPPVNRAVLAKHVVVPDLNKRRLTQVFEVLGFASDDGKRIKLVSLANGGAALDNHMRMQHTVPAQYHILSDQTVRPNPDVGSQLGGGRNDGAF